MTHNTEHNTNESNALVLLEFNDILLYTDAHGKVKVEVIYEDESFWLSQKKMAELFDVNVNTINYHLKEIFKGGELQEGSVVRIFRITASDGKNYNTNFYNLDAIIAVGCRVNSHSATQFRIWATATLKEYLDLSLEVDNSQEVDVVSPSLRIESLSNKKKKELKQKMASLRELHKQRKSEASKLINPVPNPRYDKVYKDGVDWLESLSANILAILNGINQTETESDDGWWETSTGAEFGENKLAEIKALFGERHADY